MEVDPDLAPHHRRRVTPADAQNNDRTAVYGGDLQQPWCGIMPRLQGWHDIATVDSRDKWRVRQKPAFSNVWKMSETGYFTLPIEDALRTHQRLWWKKMNRGAFGEFSCRCIHAAIRWQSHFDEWEKVSEASRETRNQGLKHSVNSDINLPAPDVPFKRENRKQEEENVELTFGSDVMSHVCCLYKCSLEEL